MEHEPKVLLKPKLKTSNNAVFNLLAVRSKADFEKIFFTKKNTVK